MIHIFKPNRRKATGKPFRLRGGRGLALLGFAGVSSLMGIAYILGEHLGPLAVWPPVARGLVTLEVVGGMRFWGILWGITAVLLVQAAFHRRQTLAMSAFAFMVTVWGISYVISFFRELLAVGHSALWLSAAIYGSLLLACIGFARMLSTPPLDMERIVQRLKQLEEECPPGTVGGTSAK